MDEYIKKLIDVNKEANKNITALESSIQHLNITTEKDKIDFGNLCIALKGFRMVSEATECLLINENVLKTIDVKTSNDKIEFGYLCIVLESLNTIVTRTGQLLFNNNVIKNEEGDYYVKVDDKV